jgi:sugar O-acyltransferase (sialic acid O-acetyltransferase NeuD family)
MNVVKELYIIGAGGFGREVADTVREINRVAAVASGTASGESGEAPGGGESVRERSGPFADGPVYRIAGFVDDDASKWGETVNDIEVKGGVDWLRDRGDRDGPGDPGGGENPCAVMAIGDPKIRRIIARKLDGVVEWAIVIHPTALISPYAVIGEGAVIQAGSSVGPNVTVGVHYCMNLYSTLGHDATLGDYVSVMSHCDITGYDVLGDGVYVATSVAIIPGVTIGENAFISAGSVVFKEVPAGVKVLGNPARAIDRSK